MKCYVVAVEIGLCSGAELFLEVDDIELQFCKFRKYISTNIILSLFPLKDRLKTVDCSTTNILLFSHATAEGLLVLNMSFDVDEFIALVRATPPLWNQKHKQYKNRHVVDRLWNEVARALNQKTPTLKKKWKSLRDQFRQELRKIPPHRLKDITPDGEYNDIPNFPQWPYFRPLLFIKDFMKTRKPLEHSPQFFDEMSFIENTDDSNENNEKYCIQSGLDLFEVETISTSQKDSKQPNDHHHESVGSKRKKLERNSKNKLLRSDDDEDEDMAFFVSLLSHVRKMDPARKLLCRMEIQNSVYNHAYRNLRTTEATFVQDESSRFSDNILSPQDHIQYDSKDHVFFQH